MRPYRPMGIVLPVRINAQQESVPCPDCAGSGIGRFGPVEDSVCSNCHGRGELDPAEVDDRTHDDEAYDRWKEDQDFAGVAQ